MFSLLNKVFIDQSDSTIGEVRAGKIMDFYCRKKQEFRLDVKQGIQRLKVSNFSGKRKPLKPPPLESFKYK